MKEQSTSKKVNEDVGLQADMTAVLRRQQSVLGRMDVAL